MDFNIPKYTQHSTLFQQRRDQPQVKLFSTRINSVPGLCILTAYYVKSRPQQYCKPAVWKQTNKYPLYCHLYFTSNNVSFLSSTTYLHTCKVNLLLMQTLLVFVLKISNRNETKKHTSKLWEPLSRTFVLIFLNFQAKYLHKKVNIYNGFMAQLVGTSHRV